MREPVLSNATLGLSGDPGWGGEAPLWYYVLKEAELPPNNQGITALILLNILEGIDLRAMRTDPVRYNPTLIEAAQDLIAVVVPDGTFRYVSPSFERILGYVDGLNVGDIDFELIKRRRKGV